MAFEEDLDVFLDEFAVTALLPGAIIVNVIFDNQYASPFDISASRPSCIGKSSDLDSLSFGAEIVVSGVDYVVRSVEPDGTGMTRLMLEKA
uniref:Phage protein n=1 Tax=Candidatus Nitrotoga fabula TaxID=2182327 RepID=A0A2X0REU1_9PROT|nr:protein of unknown function [Candidatus Nitrotoga fabula]